LQTVKYSGDRNAAIGKIQANVPSFYNTHDDCHEKGIWKTPVRESWRRVKKRNSLGQ
jgi:hypothetical protein